MNGRLCEPVDASLGLLGALNVTTRTASPGIRLSRAADRQAPATRTSEASDRRQFLTQRM
jgi:hypothetical protein